MNKSLRNLDAFINHSLEPLTLTASALDPADFVRWRTFLSDEGRELRGKLIHYLTGPEPAAEKTQVLSGVQQQLVLLSNELNRFLIRERKRWCTHAFHLEIRRHYLLSISFVDELLEFIDFRFTEFADRRVKLPDFRLQVILPGLRAQVRSLKALLKERGVDLELGGMLVKGLNALLFGSLAAADADYISYLCVRISLEVKLSDEKLEQLLVEENFNLPEFYLYLVNKLDSRLLEIHGLHEQLEFLVQQRLVFSGLDVMDGQVFMPRFPGLPVELGLYFSERVMAVEKLMEIRRCAMQDKVTAEQAFRILTDLSVPSLALFVRVQLEVGLLLKDHVTEVYNFVAQHFYTKNTVFISSGSLLKRSTDVEFSTVLNLYDMLAKMMGWLDEKFSVRNYKRY